MNVYNPVIPYVGGIQYGLNPGSLIRIQGSPHPGARCFAINLQCGPLVNPRDDIALHLSPVFSPPPRVVRNSLQAQRWGPEESYGGFPFVGGQGFEVLILVEHELFKIAINGQHFAEFRHRISLQRITHLTIDGEVSISLIAFEGGSGAGYSMPSAPPPAMTNAPYPSVGMPPYPQAGAVPYPTAGVPPYPPMGGPTPGGYAPQVYPAQAGAYPQANPTAYPHSPQSQHKSGILGGTLGGALGGLAAGAAASSIGSALLGHRGHHGHHKHSSPIPIGGLAAGAGAAALGAAVLTGHHPFKKAKKMFKHKHKFGKFHKPKFFKHKGWKHKGWSSSSSSSEEE